VSGPIRDTERVIVEARRYSQAVRGDLRNGGTVADWCLVTSRTSSDIERLANGDYHFLTARCAEKIESALPERLAEWLREAPRHDCARGEIPASVIVPVLAVATERYGGDVAAGEALGLSARRLFEIRRQHGVDHTTADLVVTRTLGADAWLNDPRLRRWYFDTRSVF